MSSNQNKTFLLCLFMNRLLEEIMFVEVFILADGLLFWHCLLFMEKCMFGNFLQMWQGFLEHRRFQLWFGAILDLIPLE